jgi:hypothetical protein
LTPPPASIMFTSAMFQLTNRTNRRPCLRKQKRSGTASSRA